MNLSFFNTNKTPTLGLKGWLIAMDLLNIFFTTIKQPICVCILFLITTIGYEIRTSDDKQLKN